jgi:FkbM family methyltransferase
MLSIKQQLRKKKIITATRAFLGYVSKQFVTNPSYSQLQEDLVIQFLFDRIDRFIDIGANDGITGSNTYLYARKGASGLCFEPVSETYSVLCKIHASHKHVKCINEGISEAANKFKIQKEGLMSFITETYSTRSEVLDEYISPKGEFQEIVVKPLNYWANLYPDFWQSDIVSIDIEGHELYALKGIDYSRFKTKCFIIETTGHSADSLNSINDLLEKNQYQALLDNNLNTFYFHKDIANDRDFREKLELVTKKFFGYKLINILANLNP